MSDSLNTLYVLITRGYEAVGRYGKYVGRKLFMHILKTGINCFPIKYIKAKLW